MPRTLRRLPSLLWAAPALVLVGVFVYYPILNNFLISLYKTGAFVPVPRFVGLANYQQAWHDPVFWTSLRNNILYAVRKDKTANFPLGSPDGSGVYPVQDYFQSWLKATPTAGGSSSSSAGLWIGIGIAAAVIVLAAGGYALRRRATAGERE